MTHDSLGPAVHSLKNKKKTRFTRTFLQQRHSPTRVQNSLPSPLAALGLPTPSPPRAGSAPAPRREPPPPSGRPRLRVPQFCSRLARSPSPIQAAPPGLYATPPRTPDWPSPTTGRRRLPAAVRRPRPAIGGHTCGTRASPQPANLPSRRQVTVVRDLLLNFDIGRSPPFAVSQDLVFVSHAHMDHIGGLPLYVATRGRRRMRPPTVFVPACLADLVRRLFEVHRAMDQSDLDHKLVPLEVGEEYELGKDLKVRAFRTYHVVPSQGYVIYKLKQKLKDEYAGLPRKELGSLRKSGVEITNTASTPEIAFTGDTMSDFILDPDNADVLKAKILVVESTYIDDSKSIEDAREKGHTHLSEIASLSDKLENKGVLLNHFSNRYTAEDIDTAINRLPPSFRSRVYALKEGF